MAVEGVGSAMFGPHGALHAYILGCALCTGSNSAIAEPETLCGGLLLADRGYFDRKYLSAVNRAGGHYVVRASASVNPVVRNAYDPVS